MVRELSLRICTVFSYTTIGRRLQIAIALLVAASAFAATGHLASPACADDPSFGERRFFGTGTDDTFEVAAGDLDGDGAIDLVVGNGSYLGTSLQNAIYLNDGNGYFDRPGAARIFGTGMDDTRSVAIGDMNGDGALDIITGNYGENNSNAVYFNDGTGHFYAGPLDCNAPPTNVHCFGPQTSGTYELAIGDMNGDGALDIVVGSTGGMFTNQNSVYLNDGEGNFSKGTDFGTGTDDTLGLAIGDIEDDGDLDIVVGNENGQDVIYLNDGSGDLSASSSFGAPASQTLSVAVGDVNSDGSLDIVTGSYWQNEVYFNDGAGVFSTTVNYGTGTDRTYRVELGDVDSNGTLDIVAGNYEGQNVIYLNDGSGDFSTSRSFGTGSDATRYVILSDVDDDSNLEIVVGNLADKNLIYLNDGFGNLTDISVVGREWDIPSRAAVGDMDNDGALDLVIGNQIDPNRIYWNDGLGVFSTSLTFDTGADLTRDVVVGDMNGDSRLDIITVGENQNIVHFNDGARAFSTTHTFGTGSDNSYSVAMGDLDGDEGLDLVVGNYDEQNVIYLNNGAGTLSSTINFGTGIDSTHSVALGDINSDGALDIVVGNVAEQDVAYLNDGTASFVISRTFGTGSDDTRAVAVGDMNGDGALDIVVGKYGEQNVVYLNDGNAGFSSVTRFGTGSDATLSLAVADVNGDGTLDIIVGNDWEQNIVYLNDGTGQFGWLEPTRTLDGASDRTNGIATGDLDGNGTLDIVACELSLRNLIYWNHIRLPERQANNPPSLNPIRPGSAAFFSTPAISDSLEISIPYTLFDPESDPIDHIEVHYSPNGGGRWLPAVSTNTITTDLTTSPWPTGTQHVFTWDTFASGFFGRSDDIVLRFEAYPSYQQNARTAAGPYQWPYAAATTFPFRVRGTQARVLSTTTPVSGAIVYRLPTGSVGGAEPLANSAGQPFRTDALGYLMGYGELQAGDRLVAMLPITTTESYTLYYTSAPPTLDGLDPYTITAPGVQTLTVSSDNPLALFDLDVSLEWDARQDTAFLKQLDFDLRRTSELLYDWTNGQAALGNVTVYHDRQNWLNAHIRIYASNRLRPSAAQGGLASDVITEIVASSVITYFPGQVWMGATWNRYGDAGGNLGEDWSRTLAHELGHYLLYLDDDYLGLDESGLLIPVDTCIGTAMTDPYRDDYSEFHLDDSWLPGCEPTLSHQTTERSDWGTIQTFYPSLSAYGTTPNAGPSSLSLGVTQIVFVEPLTPTTTLEDPTFYLYHEGNRVQPTTGARAFLFQGNRVSDLGRPTVDRVLARGARPGDRLCVIDLDVQQLGCETVVLSDEQIELVSMPGWLPEVIVTPVTSRTIGVELANVPLTLSLRARLYPVNDPAESEIPLVLAGDHYSGTFNTQEPALEGIIQVWVEETPPRREVITEYAMGGNPGHQRARLGHQRARLGHQRARLAPAMSADGQVIIFGDLTFSEGEFYALQAATVVPSPAPWATVIGHAYRLAGSENAPDLSGSSISFGYLGSEVPPGEETWLRIYYRAPSSTTWQVLPTQLDTYYNNASAPTQGEGLYALMSSIEIPLHGPGWTSFSYPVPGTRPITEALLSISGAYTTVYGYHSEDEIDPWKVYDVTVPEWVNDLDHLAFGRGYWIHVSEPVTLYLKGTDALRAMATPIPPVPATYYGPVMPNDWFSPTAGMTITAWVNDTLCSQHTLKEVAGYGIEYAIDVPVGCGTPGDTVAFRVDSQGMMPTAIWDNSQLWAHTLYPMRHVYLPLILK